MTACRDFVLSPTGTLQIILLKKEDQELFVIYISMSPWKFCLLNKYFLHGNLIQFLHIFESWLIQNPTMQKFFGFLVLCGEKLSEVCLCNMRDARIAKGFYRRVQMSHELAATVHVLI